MDIMEEIAKNVAEEERKEKRAAYPTDVRIAEALEHIEDWLEGIHAKLDKVIEVIYEHE